MSQTWLILPRISYIPRIIYPMYHISHVSYTRINFLICELEIRQNHVQFAQCDVNISIDRGPSFVVGDSSSSNRSNPYRIHSVRILIDRNLSLLPALSSPNNSRKLTLFAFQLRLSPFKGSCGMCIYRCTNVSLPVMLQWIECPNTPSSPLYLHIMDRSTARIFDTVYRLLCHPNPICYRRRNIRFTI